MATKKGRKRPASSKSTSRASSAGRSADATRTSSPIDEMLLAALERGDDSFETGRFLVTFKEDATEEGLQSLGAQGMRVADARDFGGQAADLEAVGDADAVVFPEIGVAVVGGAAAQESSMSASAEIAADSPIESIDPEHFIFIAGTPGEYLRGFAQEETESAPNEYLRGFLRAAETIVKDLRETAQPQLQMEEEVAALGATWGLNACRVPQSARSGAGIRVAVLDTGMDLGHPDFAGRLPIGQTQSFVGQPVQDLHSHGTHCIGTACGPRSPAGTTPRYGVGFRTSIFVGKVLTNSGSSVDGSVLGGMNWAIANRCEVISMSLSGRQAPVPAYTLAGQRALNNGLLMIAAAGNEALPAGAPANSPTIMSVASLDPNLRPSSFSNFGKIDIAAPGRDVFSSVPRPVRYGFKSGTSMACPHVSGCAALWAESSSILRGIALWNRLRATARPLPLPASRVGAGLVQAP
jgi:subtilisin